LILWVNHHIMCFRFSTGIDEVWRKKVCDPHPSFSFSCGVLWRCRSIHGPDLIACGIFALAKSWRLLWLHQASKRHSCSSNFPIKFNYIFVIRIYILMAWIPCHNSQSWPASCIVGHQCKTCICA
jgi:hypothetical protein